MDAHDLDAAEFERLARGDVAALERAYREHGARIQRVSLGLLGDRQEAEDAVQDVFLKVRERAGQFRGSARLSTWLHRIAVNHCLNLLEKRRVRAAVGHLDHETNRVADLTPGPFDAAATKDARRAVLERLERLSDEHRTVIVLREIDGLAYEEIAAVLQVPVGTVMSRLGRARERWIELADRIDARIPAGERTR